MKVSGATTEPFSAIRRRALAQAGAAVSGQPAARADQAAFLGVPEPEMTPAVKAALVTLLTEIDDLRGEVGRLKARLAEAETLADRDALTPLLNRRAFLRELSRVAAFAERYGSSASVVYFDLDGFKGVNDRYGHAAGDAALIAVADRLAGLVRESDLVGRMGGDEFAVALVQAEATTAGAKAETLATAIAREPLQFGEWSAPVRLSWGVAEIAPGMTAQDAVAAADAAMYARKRVRTG
jgi:diguanylate cyclase (GGDEF)-like protein